MASKSATRAAGQTVTVFEVGARDGLQNEAVVLSAAQKATFVRDLLAAGIRELELGAFVRPDRVPQMADTEELYAKIRYKRLDLGKARAWALVPNRKGLERALNAGAHNLAVFTATTESFAQRNIGMSVRESLREFAAVIRDARAELGDRARVRGYVSTVFGCPFEGKVAPAKALKVIEAVAALGVEQVSVGDTIGVATPASIDAIFKPALRSLGAPMLAAHLHDTRGTALANALRALELGVRTFDSSAGGLGGCPFAPGATGNLATEDLVYMLHGMGFRTGIDLDRLCEASLKFNRWVRRPLASRYLQAYASAANRR